MADSRNFTALDWVTGEIAETLTQAQQALEAYVSNQDDPAQIRFCLTYLHQVYSILQMVEFHGGSLLAEELEKLAQALVDGEVNNTEDAYEILMRAILQLPIYLERVKNSRRDDPSSLLPLLNDLRAIHGGALLTESALFSPDMGVVRNVKVARVEINDEKFLDAAKKLRQLYQIALLSIIKDKDYDSNLPRLEKVFSNFEKICQGSSYQPLWQIALALVEGLQADSISASVSINNLLREIEKVIKTLASQGKSALDGFDSEELIKNLLYYIAESGGDTPRIVAIKDIFQLDDALPRGEEDGIAGGVDPEAMRSVVVALSEEFSKIKIVFGSYVEEKEENNEALTKILPVFRQSADTLAVLGQGALRKNIEQLADELGELAEKPELVTGDALMSAAAQLLEIEGTLNSQFNRDAAGQDDAPPSMDIAMLTAQETVLFECQNALEQAKDGIVEFIASQWDRSHVEALPAMLSEIRGSLEMVSQRRSARILGACARYIQDKLIDEACQPDWQEMDTLADAIAGVEYYLETLDQDVAEEEDTILAVAEESVADLGYAVAVSQPKGSGESESIEEESGVEVDLSSLDDLEDLSEEAEIAIEQVKKGSALTKEKLAEIISGDKQKESDEVKTAKQTEAAEKQVKRDAAAATTLADIPDDGPLLSDDQFNSIDTATSGLELETEFNFDGLESNTNQLADVKNDTTNGDDLGDDYGVLDFDSLSSESDTESKPETELEEELKSDELVIEMADESELELDVELDAELDIDLSSVLPIIEEEDLGELDGVDLELPEEAEISLDLDDTLSPASSPVSAEEDEGELILDDFEHEDFDGEIAEIFIEEVEEVLENVNEFYPKWKDSSFQDESSLKEFRRGFHTMKGSGRMAKAIAVGELAWSVENMLNRVMDGTYPVSSDMCELIERTLEKIPSMMEAFKNKQPDPDPQLSRRYRLIGEALSNAETPLPFSLSASASDAEENTDEEIDWELWEIFVSEAEGHLEVADEWIAQAKEQLPLLVELTDPLQRAMHTLKGSAYMAEIFSIGDLASPLEKFIKSLRAFQIQVSDEFVDLLALCVTEVRIGLEQINNKQLISLPNTDDLHQRISVMRLALTGESDEGTVSVPVVSESTVDLSKWNAFLGGEMDALMDAVDVLDVWQGNSSDAAPLEPLLAELDSMAEAAEPAGLLPITSLSRLMAQAYRKVAANQGLGQSELLPLVLGGHEDLINFIDELVSGQDIQTKVDLENRLQQFIGEENESVGESTIDLDALVADVETVDADATEIELNEPETVELEEIEPVEVAVELETEIETPPVFELTKPEDFDLELLEIFLEEAVELLEELDAVIADWNDDPTDASQADALKRILHTYKGGARMAGLSALGTLAHDLETQLETFSGIADAALLSQINDYQDRLIKGTDRAQKLMSGESVNLDELAYFGAIASTPASGVVIPEPEVVAGLEEVVTEEAVPEETMVEEIEFEIDVIEPVSELLIEENLVEVESEAEVEVNEVDIEEPAVVEAAETASDGVLEYSDDIDAELLEIFIEEALELLEELDNSIAAWQSSPADSAVDELKRILHTLKGGARMSGMMGLGSLAHDLETYLETFTGIGDDALFAMLNNYQDRIIVGVEQAQALAAGETPQAAPATGAAVNIDDSIDVEIEMPVEEDTLALTETSSITMPVVTESKDLANKETEEGAEIIPFTAAARPTGLDEQADKRAAAKKGKGSGPQEMVKISADLVDQLVNLAGETSITRGRIEQQVLDFGSTLNDVDGTIKRLQDQLRRMEIETEAQVQSKIEEMRIRQDDFDPLEMDQYSTLQQLTRSLMETSSDLIDLRGELTNKARETEMILLQQSRINTELQEGLMSSRMVPFSRMVPRLRRIVRQVGGELKKEVDFDLVNVEGEMDRTVLERMVAPLEHMLRNALDHGVEMPVDREKKGKPRRGRVVLSFGREGGDVVIALKDDGGGIPVEVIRKKAIERGLITEDSDLSEQEILQFIMHAGFSTKDEVSEISGRGVGMDVVSSEIKQLGGTMTILSELGHGTEFVVRLPFTVSINRALMVRVGEDLYAVPLNSIEGIVRVSPFELENYYQDKEARFEYASDLYEVRYLGALLHTKERPNLDGLVLPESVILVRGADHSIALHVDQLLGSREIVVKSLGPQFGSVPGLSGATILGDGSVVVILDPMALVRAMVLLETQSELLNVEVPLLAAEKEAEQDVFTVMVVDDSVTVRKVTSRFLEREGFNVVLAKDGADAMLQLQDFTPDVMLLDIEMPRMDGFEVATSVKNTDRLKDIPIIMITSRTGDKHRERAMSIGVERYMGKPFVEDELLETVNQLLGEQVRRQVVSE